MKDRVTATIDEDLAAKLRTENNMSGVVNAALEAYYGSGTMEEEITRQRVEELRTERQRLQQHEDKLREQQKVLQSRLEDMVMPLEDVVEQARPYIEGVDNPQNPVVKRWANEANVAPSTLLEEVNGNGESA